MSGAWRRFFVTVLSLTPCLILAPLVVAEQSTASSGVQVVETWAGMSSSIVPGTRNSFHLAEASWTVPEVRCPSGANSAVSNWAGAGDGTQSNPLFQAGSESECRAGVARYRAWWEEFPVNHQRDFVDGVHPGDVMDSLIRWAPSTQSGHGTVSMELEDFSSAGAKEWVEYHTVRSAPPSDQAECIIERPLISGGHEPLADFGTTQIHGLSSGMGERQQGSGSHLSDTQRCTERSGSVQGGHGWPSEAERLHPDGWLYRHVGEGDLIPATVLCSKLRRRSRGKGVTERVYLWALGSQALPLSAVVAPFLADHGPPRGCRRL